MGLPVSLEEVPESIGRRPVITYLLIGVNVIVYAVFSSVHQALGFSSYDDVLKAFGTYPSDVLDPTRFYRVFTSMFLHANMLHLLGNMIFLYVFGRDVEKIMGRVRFLAFYIVCGIVADIFNTLSVAVLPSSYLLSKVQEYILPWLIPSVGASGAISGVLGAYLVLFPRAKIIAIFYFFPILMTAEFYIFIWFLYQLVMGLTLWSSAGVAFWAHIGGFLGGMACLPIFVNKRLLRLARRYKEFLRLYGTYV